METPQIRQAVLETLAAIAPETDPLQIRPDRPLRPQIELDSLDWLNVLTGLQERLSIAIPTSDAGHLTTLDSIVAYLAARLTEPALQRQPAAAAAPGRLPHAQHVVDGQPVTVRPIRPGDIGLERDFIRHLSTEARYQRFLVTVSELPDRKLHYFTEVDQVTHVALAAVADHDGQPAIVGVARYIVMPAGDSCEFAIAVDDAWQGSGLAGILMHALIDAARSRGLATMEGTVLATNTRMRKFTRQLGFTQQRDPQDRDTVHVMRRL